MIPLLIWYLWLVIIAAQLVLAAVIFCRRGHRLYPCFALFALYCALGSVVLLAGQHWFGRVFYLRAYRIELTMEPVLLYAVVFNLVHFLFWPIQVLPLAQRRTFLISLLCIIGASLLLSFVWPSNEGERILAQIRTFDQAVSVISCGVIFAVVWVAHQLSIPWRQHAHGIAVGFLLYLPVRVLGALIIAHSSRHTTQAVSLVWMSSFLASVIIWVTVFARLEPARARLTEDQIRQAILLLNRVHLTFRLATSVDSSATERDGAFS